MIKNKFYILILIGSILNYSLFANFSYAFSFFNFGIEGVEVPVEDSSVITGIGQTNKILATMNKFLSENIQKLNDNIQLILNSLIEDKVSGPIGDTLQEKTYIEYSAELEKIIEKNKIKSQEDIEEDLKEAQLAGIISALEKFSKLSCLPIEKYEYIYSYTNSFINGVTDVDFSEMIKNALVKIPICETSLANKFLFADNQRKSSQKNFLAKLLKPFNIGLLAQQNQQVNNNEDVLPSFEIAPAFQEIENSIETIKLENEISILLDSEIREKASTRILELNEIRPIEECKEYKFIESGEDEGKFVCLDYQTIIPLKDLSRSLKNNNPLTTRPQDLNTYEKRLLNHNLLSKLGLTTSTLATTSDLSGSIDLGNRNETAKLIDRTCYIFALSSNLSRINQQKASTLSSYVKCLETFYEKTKSLVNIEKRKTQDLIASAKMTQNEIERLKTELESLEEKLNQFNNYKGAKKDILVLKNNLTNMNIFYKNKITDFENILIKINNTQTKINEIDRTIKDIMSRIFLLPLEILSTMDDILRNFSSFIDVIAKIFGISGSYKEKLKEAANFISYLKDKFIYIDSQIFSSITLIFQSIYNILNDITSLIANINTLQYEFYKSIMPFSRSTILNDVYKLNEIKNRIEAYKAYIEKTQQNSNIISEVPQTKNKKHQVIIVEQKEKNTPKLLNIFKWKSFEITFQK